MMPATWSWNVPVNAAYTYTQPWEQSFQQQQFQTGVEQWGIGHDEEVRQFNLTLKRDYDYWDAQYKQAVATAEISARASEGYAAAGLEGDRVRAQADVEAANIAAASARYNADMSYKIAQLDDATKLQISREANKLEAIKWEATQFQHPSKWAEQEEWFAAGGKPAIETPTRSIVPNLPTGGELPVGATPSAQWPGQAIAGEAGPELVTATPGGAQITPLQRSEAWRARVWGMPAMAEGGQLSAWSQQRLQPWLQQQLQVPGRSPEQTSWLRWQLAQTVPRQASATAAPSVAPRQPTPSTVTRSPFVGYGQPGAGQAMQNVTADWRTRAQQARAAQQAFANQYMAGYTPGVTPMGSTAGGAGVAAPTRTRTIGGTAGPTAAGGTAAGTTATETPAQAAQRSVLSYLRGEEPFPGYGGQQLGQFQIPGGANYGIVPLPGQINLTDFLRLPYDMQQMYLSATEATYSMTPENVTQWMNYFSPRGIAQPVPIWG